MKRFMLASTMSLGLASPALAATLTVNLDGIRASGGTLYVSVQSRDQFMQDRGTAGDAIPAPKAGSHRFSYDVPAGEYAVSVWHDDNGNGRFDKNENHVPLDGWAMLNGERLRGEPKFDEVRTIVGKSAETVNLKMTYGR
jgi:uncharacterized protein (DUF2141 family)